MSTAAATSVSPPTAKEAKGTLSWRVDVTIIGNHRRNCRSNDRVVYPPYFPLHDVAARIKERPVDNAVGLDGQRRCQRARQLQVQSKVDVVDRGRYAGGTSVKSRDISRDRSDGYKNRSPIFSYERSPSVHVLL